VAQVNAMLAATGEQPRLRRGNGYYYFDGEATAWPESSVYIFRADAWSVEQWLAEYQRLKVVAR
jgi:hypothetical protein